ncbi:MAG: hypothetical protein DI628_02160 [Blastochloris viridis]|uniref:Uncharacterized protein n=1 Tax=Blastochloris viridis TaxID=1079 RepID=A0A6N4RBP1_BLAVI|nr:MAG: hypothetical protein DI628_02160 [Blastochloris viridis]
MNAFVNGKRAFGTSSKPNDGAYTQPVTSRFSGHSIASGYADRSEIDRIQKDRAAKNLGDGMDVCGPQPPKVRTGWDHEAME